MHREALLYQGLLFKGERRYAYRPIHILLGFRTCDINGDSIELVALGWPVLNLQNQGATSAPFLLSIFTRKARLFGRYLFVFRLRPVWKNSFIFLCFF